MLELFILILFSFFLRILFSLSSSSDTVMHLWQINKEKRNKIFNHFTYQGIEKKIQGYPSFIHSMISLFPSKLYIPIGYLLNIVFDLIIVTVIYYVANDIFISCFLIESDIVSNGFIVALMYSVNPIILPISARMKSIGARTFGSFILLLYMYSVYNLVINDNSFDIYLYFIISVVLITLSSQFALQAMISFSIVFSIYYSNYSIIIGLISLMGFFYLTDLFGIKQVLNHKLNHWIWYFRRQSKGTTASDRNKFIDILKLPYYLIYDREAFYKVVFLKSTFIILLYSLPQIFILLFNFSEIERIIFTNSLLEFFFVMIIASIVTFIITSLKPFLFLGQAERYFEFTIFPIMVFFYLYCIQTNNIGLLILSILFNLIVVFILFIASNYKTYRVNFFDVKDSYFQELMAFINTALIKHSKKANILVLPTKFSFEITNYVIDDRIKFYYPFVSALEGIDGFEDMQKDEEELYYLKNDFVYLKNKYDLNFVLLYKHSMKNKWFEKYTISLKKYNLIFENDHFIIYGLGND